MKEFNIENSAIKPPSDEQSFNYEKLFIIIKKVWLWIPLVIVLSLIIARIYLKYVKPVYVASSLIKLEVQKEASNLGLSQMMTSQNDNLLGEVELLKSPLVANEVQAILDLRISYFATGEILSTEIYDNSPFAIDVLKSNNGLFTDQIYYITFINEYEFQISKDQSEDNVKLYKIGDIIKFDGYDFVLKLVKGKAISSQKTYFFKINSDATLTSYLLNNLVVEISNNEARTLSISFTDNNRQKAIDIVDAYNQAYMKQSSVSKQKSQEQTLAYIDEQIRETSQKLESYERDIEMFVKQSGSFSPISEYTELTNQLIELEKNKKAVQYSSKNIDELYKFIEANESKDNIIPIIIDINNVQIAEGVNNLNNLYKQRELLKISNKETTIPFKKIDIEISMLKTQIISYIQESKRYINEQNKQNLALIGELSKHQSSLPSKETELNRLKRFNALYEKFYLSLLEKQIEYRITKAGTVSELTILSSAYASTDPISPNKNNYYLFFLVLFLAPIILYIFYQFVFNNVVYSKKFLEKKLMAPILGVIPSFSGKMPSSTIVVDKNPKSAISESLRSIRTNSEFMLTKKSKQIIGVTSTVSGEGKTFFAINYAAILALSGKKVIILDLDMRKPKIHVGFNTNNIIGMSSILSGSHNYNSAIHQTNVSGLDFITAGPIPPNPNELLLKNEFDDLVDSLFDSYDIIVADNPPIGLVSDANVIFRKCDLSIYVIRAGYTKEKAIEDINHLFLKNKYTNLSVVLNDVNQNNTYGKYSYGDNYNGYYSDDVKISKWESLKSKFIK
jgi:tyrosine-protein kinase Etk/Wzc